MSKDKKDGIFGYAEGYDKFLMLFGILGSIGDGLQIPLMMYVLSAVINDYGNPHIKVGMSIVNKYSLRLLYVAILVGLSAFVEGLCWARTAERQTSKIRLEYLKSVLKQDVGFFDTQEAGSSTTYQVVSTISADSNTIQITIGEKIPNCLAYLSSFFFCHVFAFVLSWKLTLSALPFSVMILVPALGFGKHMMDVAMAMVASYGAAGSIAEQAISSIRTVYSYVGETQTIIKFSKALETTTGLGIKQGLARGLMLGSLGMVYVSWAFQAWIGSILVSKHGEKGGDIFVAGFNVLMAGLNILTALPNLTAITESQGAATRINEMINRKPTIDTEDKKGKALSYVRGEIEFKGVYFSYPSRPDTTILHALNLRVPAGKTVGLVGGSGSGKSTTVSLIQRFYDPIEGDIFLDGYKIKKLHLKWLRSQMGLVNQEPILFATSIKENILFGKEGASMDDIVAAAKSANAHDYIVKLPDGYETNVGQFGFQLSGGQKQRIAIARALIRDPKILLLDEATSALDTQSERIVQEAIDHASVGRTTIVIAHRLSTIKKANLIYVLQSGKVVESGSHNELMQMSDGEYYKMVQLQQSEPQNEYSHRSSNTPSRCTRAMAAPSPVSARSSAPGTPSLNPFSPAFSLSAPYSVQFDDSYESDDEDGHSRQPSHPAPSQFRLLKMNAPEWPKGLFGCIGAIGSGAVQPINAYCVGGLISVYFRPDKSTIISHARIYSFVFLGLGVFSFFTFVAQHYYFAVMGEKLTTRVREKLLEKLLTFEIGWYDQDENTSAAICARLSTEANMVRSLVGDRLSLLTQAFFGALFAYVLGLVLSWKLALVLMAAQPFLIGSFYARGVLMKSLSERAQKAQKEGSQLASEAVINHRTITAFSSQKRIVGLFKDTLEGPRIESIRQSYFSGIGLASSQFMAAASTALAYWYGGRLLSKDMIEPKNLFQAFLVLLFTAYSIADAGSMTRDISRGSNAVGSVFAILDKQTEIDPNTSWGRESNKGNIRGRVELKNVFFAYPTRPDQMVFKGLNLKVRQGTSMALVGPSGSGKSTIIGLIERFYDPLKGSVLIDERDVKDYNLRALRLNIALVSQEPTLFAGTIRENIAYGKANAKESEIRKAAMLANAHEFISGMKDGYETYCGERGVQLSGGQKQRIALARAMLKNPSILLLDEATSALDTVSENLVQEAIDKLMNGRTCIVVAHRLSTIQKSDLIAVIQEGKVAEQGSHSDLLSVRGGAYYNLVKMQGGRNLKLKKKTYSSIYVQFMYKLKFVYVKLSTNLDQHSGTR
ncbi:putative multidrug resistance protein [Rutidosis leptorrhynchoides]|uniref:putative multidrug resistance protein n=1 Tax=Rutidosis leptorrhynchoides TaxID=125765 RepID=UPI003A99C3C6